MESSTASAAGPPTAATRPRPATAAGGRARGPRRPVTAYVPLFWRLFVPNAAVLAAACVLLWLEPANGRLVALLGGLAVMIVVNVVLMRRAFAPLRRLTATMYGVDPLRPGQRIEVRGPDTEVTVLAQAFNAMLDRVETERRESALRSMRAQEEERRRLTAELHDELGQSLTALALELQHVNGRISGEGGDPLAEAKGMTRAAIADVRRLVRGLRPEVLDELGLAAALTNLCDRMAAGSGVAIRRSLTGPLPRLGAELELVVYRVAQESITNAVRHASPSVVDVVLRSSDGVVELRVRDDGTGLPDPLPRTGGQGIRGMRERAVAVGATLTVGAHPGGGTEVRLTASAEPGAP